MPYKPQEKVCQVCGITFMGDPRSKTCGRTCATRGVNSRRTYKTGENHYNFKHCAKQRHRKEYMAWVNMKERCLRETCGHYYNYGGRGIKIFEPWINDFNAFFAHIGAAPSPAHSVGRIDNDGHYEPGNVEWQTKSEQMSNRRNNRWIEHEGIRMIMADWAKLFKIQNTNLFKMIKKYPFDYIYDYYMAEAFPGKCD